ncbi:MAG: hypothetical protein EOO72_07165 [Myxococcaceae bacterium]|nr:MAG: hypothetical protein EOO72_07165 [Myxococcaceae bacterium]
MSSGLGAYLRTHPARIEQMANFFPHSARPHGPSRHSPATARVPIRSQDNHGARRRSIISSARSAERRKKETPAEKIMNSTQPRRTGTLRKEAAALRAFPACIAALALTLSGASGASTVAITEFLVDPSGTDLLHEWVELFNYGGDAVDVSGWTLKDNSSSAYTFPTGTSIPSGGYLIVAQNGLAFTDRWLGGVADARVLSTIDTTDPEANGRFQLNNGAPGDGLYLRDASSALVWSLGFNITTGEPLSARRATWLTGNDFTTTGYGVPPQDGTALINRNGTDGTGTLGYEDNNRTEDPLAIQQVTDWGSPLAGGYTVIPEPGIIALSSLGLIALLRRRRGA